MNLYLKETIKSLLIIFIILIVSSLIINLLYYFDILNNHFIKYLKLILSIIAFFTGGIYMGKHSPNKGYIYGLRLSIIMVIFFIIFGIIFNNFQLTRLIYYFIITISITFGAMLGIQKKNN